MRYWGAVCLLVAATAVGAADLRSIPDLSGPVMDEAGLLKRNELAALESELALYPPQMQLQIWIVNSLQGEPIESLSIRAVEKWKLGTTKEDRGALLLVALGDRKMRIEVGQGLEGEIPDISAGRIVRQVLAPSFQSGDFFGGLLKAGRLLYVAAGGNGEALPQTGEAVRDPKVRRGGVLDIFFIFGIGLIFILFFFLNLLPRRNRFGGGNYWGGGSGGGWSGGGGSWGGGGGGFSGGGSSGSW